DHTSSCFSFFWGTLSPQGESWLCCAVVASEKPPAALAPELKMTPDQVAIREPGGERKLSFTL
ncbi:hypothetical protein, partial [Enterobacter cloacae]